jgi:hypothetical protein
MAQYRTCAECGAHLDYGEQCGCGDKEADETTREIERSLAERAPPRDTGAGYAKFQAELGKWKAENQKSMTGARL